MPCRFQEKIYLYSTNNEEEENKIMGYYISQRETEFGFKKNTESEAVLRSIQELCKSNTNFSWVNNKIVLEAKTLQEALAEWRWSYGKPFQNYPLEFTGEKIGDDITLFRVIAPYVKKGSFIEMVGEDGARWRWTFNGVTATEKSAKIVWK